MIRLDKIIVLLSIAWLFSAFVLVKSQTVANRNGNQSTSPNALPIQNYVALDLSESAPPSLANASITSIAIDDQHNVAFGSQIDGGSPATAITYSNGRYGGLIVSPPDNSSDSERRYYFNGLFPNGQWAGDELRSDNDPSTQPGTYGVYAGTLACLINGSDVTHINLGAPFSYNRATNHNGETSFISYASTGYSISAAYTSIDNPSDPNNPYKGVHGSGSTTCLIYGGDKIVCFCDDLPAFLTDNDTVAYVRTRFSPQKVNDKGGALGYADDGYYVWDGRQLSSKVSLDRSAVSVYCDINNQCWTILNDPEKNSFDGAFWHAGATTKFSDLLKGGPWEHQLQKIQPLLLSNENPLDGQLYIVAKALDDGVNSPIQDDGTNEFLLWKGAPVENSTEKHWQPYKMVLPDDVQIDWYAYEAISSSGVIAAIGTVSGSDNCHALLLLPLDINTKDRLLSGSITIPDGWKNLGIQIKNATTGQDLGTYNNLGENLTSSAPDFKIYNSEDDFYNDDELSKDDNGTLDSKTTSQPVIFFKDAASPNKLHFATTFDQLGDVEIHLYKDGKDIGKAKVTLKADRETSDLITTIDARIASIELLEIVDPPDLTTGGGVIITPGGGSLNRLVQSTDQDGGSSGKLVNRGLTTKSLLGYFKPTLQVVVGIPASLVRGFVDGAWDGIKSDVSGLKEIGKFATHPFVRGAEIYHSLKALRQLTFEQIKGLAKNAVDSFLDSAEQSLPWSYQGSAADNSNLVAYITGYTVGFAGEQIGSAYLVAGVVSKAGKILKAVIEATQAGRAVLSGVTSALKFQVKALRAITQFAKDTQTVREMKRMVERISDLQAFGKSAGAIINDGLAALGGRVANWNTISKEVAKYVGGQWNNVGYAAYKRLAQIISVLGVHASEDCIIGFLRFYGSIVTPTFEHFDELVAKFAGIDGFDSVGFGKVMEQFSDGAAGMFVQDVSDLTTWKSKASGLLYTTTDIKNNWHRIMHVLKHTLADGSTPSVFSVARKDVFPLIDEAWAKGVSVNPSDPFTREVEMGRVIGTQNETVLRIVVDPATNKVLTSYPIKVKNY